MSALDGFDAEKKRNWEPKPSERQWLRNVNNGDRGFLVRSGGCDMVKLDRPGEPTLRNYKEDDWVPERERRPLTRAQAANIAFEADRKLCAFIGLHDKANQEWLGLPEEKRLRWMNKGPRHPDARRRVYMAIMGALQGEMD